MQPINCPALFIAAPASGQGKTTLAAALARFLTRQGKRVRIFKTGPDYLDPQILSQASGQQVIPLDMWMAGEDWCQQQLYMAAQEADIILVEGAMGMFDGEPSSADLAARFNIPLAIVMDVKGMGQTAAAIASGLAAFRQDIHIMGLIANRCGSERHRQLIEAALPDHLPLLLSLARSADIVLPERHLGLVQAEEVAEQLERCFDSGADRLAQGGIDQLLEAIQPVTFRAKTLAVINPYLLGKTIAIAKDSAFSFIYQENLQLLKEMGANIAFFSPIKDSSLPLADALWLPGGYPELHAKKLSANQSMIASIHHFYQQNKPILAECGGFLYTLESLTDLDSHRHTMVGLLAGEGVMCGKQGCQGMQTAALPEGDIRAHSHHRSRSSVSIAPLNHGRRQRHPAPGEAIYRQKNLTASYLHLFFPSNPKAVAQLFHDQTSIWDTASVSKRSMEKNNKENIHVQ
ncbi:cobyrinic acid a,c-diamide synthase [Candidatus Endobugula sertula]|uniref:Cobyrinic acid a,c-diamide synthase n=1 Tax=Candidatus Endobugula sertula TaxID=62101 RepID=A0A1D2QM14_9GAMM|nr:cobyrinic acid a,c-diamide synthase [Candidatus Endobugula sertula]